VTAHFDDALPCYQKAYHLFAGLGDSLKSGEMQCMMGRIYSTGRRPTEQRRSSTILPAGAAEAVRSILECLARRPLPFAECRREVIQL
jgi:hypothetical protein